MKLQGSGTSPNIALTLIIFHKIMQAPPLRLFPHSFAKVRLSEQNTKQKGKFFHFCLYFRAKVPSTDRSKLRIFFYSAKKKVIFFKK